MRASQLSSLDHLIWVIVVVVCLQAVLTFLAQGISTIFGQDLLSSAREFIVADRAAAAAGAGRGRVDR